MARRRITMKKALEEGIFGTQFCAGCGKEGCRLYILRRGMYAGDHHCRSCAIEILDEMGEEE